MSYLLLADSGSTKTDWALVKDQVIVSRIKTLGINPYFQSAAQISSEIRDSLVPRIKQYISDIASVHYYGTGCSSSHNCMLVEQSLRESLGVSEVSVSHDLLAAARALCGNNPGISAILGTGSNSCLYDGEKVVENVPSAGYLWSDYGGGSQIGKFFIRDYFEGTLPPGLRMAFEEAGYNRESILENVYKTDVPARYLASVSLFLRDHSKDPYVDSLIGSCFDSFFIHQVNHYTGSRNYSVNTVGSVGFHYRDIFSRVAEKHGYTVGNMIQSPIEGLIRYHSS